MNKIERAIQDIKTEVSRMQKVKIATEARLEAYLETLESIESIQIDKHIPDEDDRQHKLETLAKLLAKAWHHNHWEWETPNERVMEMLMRELGYFPFDDEDQMIKATKVDEKLYIEAIKKITTRSNRGEISEIPIPNE